MIIDSHELAPGSQLQYDICIIGAGAAGITLARALNSEQRSICVLESGGFESETDAQSLYVGETKGAGMSSANYLRMSRLRYFGGTTNHWTGFCRPLDASDFQTRPWVPHSGWPIDRNELAPYYERAAEVVQIKPFDNWGEMAHTPDAVMPPSAALVAKRFHFSRIRFGRVYRDELREAKSVNVILHANVVNLEVDEAGSAVSRVHVATFSGRRFAVSARLVVLATGAIENARLLLISDAKHETGLGNRSDRVGRFFMDHPVIGGGLVCLTHPGAALRLDELGGFLGLSGETQRAHEILNVCVELNPRRDSVGDESEAGGTPLELRDLFYRLATLGGPGVPADAGHDYRYRRCFIYAEPAPYPDSRVTLDRETDALGLRRARLFWKTTTLETRSIQRAKEILALELGRRRIGRMLLDTDDEAGTVALGEGPWSRVRPANHHMGTTRMSASPSDGVVDRNCQVHDVSNLFIAGSSVFPTVGFANPTFTIVALALRLAQHLVARLDH
jgi:choline dehydrogenase-like flavoprotein